LTQISVINFFVKNGNKGHQSQFKYRNGA